MARTALAAASARRLLQLAVSREGALLQIENTNYCNYRCAYCATHAEGSTMVLPRGHMTVETFARIVESRPRALLVIIQGDGEPFLDPTLFEKIRIARAAGRVTQVISNGSLLRPALIERIVAEGPDVLLFSVDAASPERVMAQRRGMRHAEVLAGVKALCRARAASARPMILGLLSIVYGRFDAETEAALRAFDALDIDVLFYKQLNGTYKSRIRGYEVPPIDGVPPRAARSLGYWVSHQRLATIRPCAALRHGFSYFLWDGTETACCVLNHPQYAAPAFTRARLLERFRERSLPEECERCSFFGGYGDER